MQSLLTLQLENYKKLEVENQDIRGNLEERDRNNAKLEDSVKEMLRECEMLKVENGRLQERE